MKRIFLLFLTLFLPVLTYANDQPIKSIKEPTVSEALPSVTTSPKSSNNIEELRLLNKQLAQLKVENKLLKDHQSAILSTVLWSLSFLAGVAFLLLTFGWWSNSKMHEKDKLALMQEFEVLLKDHEAHVNQGIDEKLSLTNSSVNQKLSEHFTEQRKTIHSIKESVDKKFENLDSEVNKITEKININASSIDKLGQSQLLVTRKLAASIFDVEEMVWEIKGVYRNVVLTQAQLLDAANEANDDQRIEVTLQRAIRTLNKFIRDEMTLNQFHKTRLTKSLNSLNSEFDVAVSEIFSLLDQITYKD